MITKIKKEQLLALNQVNFAQQSHITLINYCEALLYTLSCQFDHQQLTSKDSSLSPSLLLPWQQLKMVKRSTFIDIEKSIENVPISKPNNPKNKATTRKKWEKNYRLTQVLKMQNTVLLHASVCAIEATKGFGTQLLALLKHYHDAVYAAHKRSTKISIKAQLTETLSRIETLCQTHRDFSAL